MAQRTSADGFIALRAKVASAGVFLALATAVAFALSGCGGGSDTQTQSTSDEGAQATTPGQGPEGVAGGRSQSVDEEEGATQQASKVKQGPHIEPPKGPRERAATPVEVENATVADIALESPALGAAQGADSTSLLPAEYTCDGKGDWPELRWSGVPADSEELILLVLALEPVDEAFFFNWAVAGLEPSLEGIQSGKLPKGATVGRNGFGHDSYEICPAQDAAETYIFALYALPKALSPKQGFDPASLREQVLEISGNAGLMAVSYG